MPLKLPSLFKSDRITSSHFSRSSSQPTYFVLSTQHVDGGLYIPFSLRTIRPMFWMILTNDVFGSTKTHMFAFLVSMPSPMVSHEDMIYTSLSKVLSNFFKMVLRSPVGIEALSAIISNFLYNPTFSGNSFVKIFVNASSNSSLFPSFANLSTEVLLSLSRLTSARKVSTRLFPLTRIARAILS